ncbi:hypothetical protein SAMN05216302_10744 [Nitrosomonas aestuarii]|uniref:Uncharacterized protein n=1 Tax=Nitrosomonas aestuarii TaxID=52441 RepID=A0A1I4H891_9PROT|nr:hypothetical protein [Nitrosomonas aestuarii]SFL38498.1 hypothetical protein SAMN05216302_10744 [Nitrosomonas aestuarii]
MKNQISIEYIIIILLSCFYLPAPLVAWGSEDEAAYLCVVEESTGFHFENGKWGRAHFNVSEEKFIIRKIKPDELYFNKDHPYGVYRLGKNSASLRCKAGKNIVCDAGLGELLFSPESGRFIKTYPIGYWDGSDNNEDTPNISRGRCSKI